MNQPLRAALAQGKTKQVIAELLKLTTHEVDLHNQVVQLSARFAQYKKQQLGNLENSSVLGIELNKINETALAIIDELSETAQITVSISSLGSSNILEIEKKSIEIILEGQFDKFDKDKFTTIIATFLDITTSSVRVLQVYQGSIIVILELPAEEADNLIFFFNDSEIDLRPLEKSLSENLIATSIIKISFYKRKPINLQSRPDNPVSNNSSTFSWTEWTGLNDVKSWIALLAGLAAIFTFYFKYCGNEAPVAAFKNVTVIVRGKDGALIEPLHTTAFVIMTTSGGGAPKELIDDKGAASFKNIKIGDKVRLNIDFSEPYRPVQPDSIYTVPEDGRIHLVVALQHLGEVFGRVMYRDKELSGVIVAVGGLRDTTDDLGRYKIQIPESEQRQEQEVFFKKEGFKSIYRKVFPQTDQPLNVVMEK